MEHLLCVTVLLSVIVICYGNQCSLQLSSIQTDIRSDAKLIYLDLDFTSEEILKPNETLYNSLFKPTRWFIVRGESTNRLLLLTYFYYGYFEPYLIVSNQHVTKPINSTPQCLTNISNDDSIQLIRDELLNASKNLEGNLNFGNTEVCSMFIRESVGFGILVFRCCKLIENEQLCTDVENDFWVWILHVSVWCFSIFLFLYFPKFIPRTIRPKAFHFTPSKKISLSTLKTSQISKYKHKLVLPISVTEHMNEFNKVIRNLPANALCALNIKSVNLHVQRSQLLSETDQAVSFFRLLYDLFIRFKIRHIDCLHDFCFSPICGSSLVDRKIIPWYKCLMRFRTLFIYSLILLPAIPLMYVLTGNNQQSNELAERIHTLGMLQPENFNPGIIAGKIIVGVLCSLYILHIIMVLSIDSFQNELMEILDIEEDEDSKTQVNFGRGRLFNLVLQYLTKYGIFSIPVFVVLLLMSPVIILIYFIITAPVFRILLRQFKKLCGLKSLSSSLTGPKCGPKLSILLFISLLSVFVVVTIGIYFLIQCLCIILVNILINWYFSMSLVSIVVLIFVYVRDSAKRLEGKYNSYFNTIFKQIMALKDSEIRAEAKKSYKEQKAIAFQVKKSDIEEMEPESGGGQSERETMNVWDVKHGYPRIHTSGVILFLDKHDVPFIPMRFFEDMTFIDCPGCPGPLINSLTEAIKDLLVVGLFLLFLFLLVMSYGETVSVTPSTRFFATLVTGLIPLLLRSFFFASANQASLDTSTLRFRNQFLNNVLSFEKRWPIQDCDVDEPYAFLLWKAVELKEKNNKEIDLLIDTSSDSKGSEELCCVSVKIGNLC